MISPKPFRSLVFTALLIAAAATCTAKEFTALAIGDSPWAGISYLPSNAEPVLLDLSPNRRSKAQQATESTLVFIRQRINSETGLPMPTPKPSDDTKPPAPIARVTLPADQTNVVLMFLPRAKPTADGLEYDVVPVDDSLETFPADSLRVLNLTTVPLQAQIGEQRVEIKPGLSPAVGLLTLRKPEAAAIPFSLGVAQAEGKTRTLYRGPIEARATTRTLVTVHPPGTPDSRKMRVSVVLQTVELPKAK